MIGMQEKEIQIRKFDELIKQSENAVNKMIQNTMKLNEALQQALEDNLWTGGKVLSASFMARYILI